MRYFTFDNIKDHFDSILAKKYLQQLWYQIEEGFIETPLEYHHLIHFQHLAPNGWYLTSDGSFFSLHKSFPNHGLLYITIQVNGYINYKLI
jgi:hypothetical protein